MTFLGTACTREDLIRREMLARTKAVRSNFNVIDIHAKRFGDGVLQERHSEKDLRPQFLLIKCRKQAFTRACVFSSPKN